MKFIKPVWFTYLVVWGTKDATPSRLASGQALTRGKGGFLTFLLPKNPKHHKKFPVTHFFFCPKSSFSILNFQTKIQSKFLKMGNNMFCS
jgi:hypothetical protein